MFTLKGTKGTMSWTYSFTKTGSWVKVVAIAIWGKHTKTRTIKMPASQARQIFAALKSIGLKAA